MNKYHSPFWTIVRKEVADHVRSWRFLILIGIIALTCMGSLYTALTNIGAAIKPNGLLFRHGYLRLLRFSAAPTYPEQHQHKHCQQGYRKHRYNPSRFHDRASFIAHPTTVCFLTFTIPPQQSQYTHSPFLRRRSGPAHRDLLRYPAGGTAHLPLVPI